MANLRFVGGSVKAEGLGDGERETIAKLRLTMPPSSVATFLSYTLFVLIHGRGGVSHVFLFIRLGKATLRYVLASR